MFRVMLRKISVYSAAMAALALCFSVIASPALAHDLWLNAQADPGQKVRVDVGYGHHFPNPEPIPKERLHIFELPPKIFTPQGELKIVGKDENYAFTSSEPLGEGSYLGSVGYRPTCWSKGPGGWKQQDRTQRPDATYVEEVVMYGKAVFNVGESTAIDFITKPMGDRFEIIPLVNPATVKPGAPFPLQVLFDGKPAKLVEVTATFGGFSDKEYKAFSGRTDLKGNITLIPLKEGYWFAEATYVYDHENQKKADEMMFISTLSFRIDK